MIRNLGTPKKIGGRAMKSFLALFLSLTFAAFAAGAYHRKSLRIY
jgi:hypothetical protein